jgi:hypothetical protein
MSGRYPIMFRKERNTGSGATGKPYHQRQLDCSQVGLTRRRWSEPLTGAKLTFDDFNTETCISTRSRQRSLSCVSLGLLNG